VSSHKVPSLRQRLRKAGAKHSSASCAGTRLAFGSPATIRQKMRSSRPNRLNAATSSFTQRDVAELGEQMTSRLSEPESASFTFAPRSAALASSSVSRKMGESRRGTT